MNNPYLKRKQKHSIGKAGRASEQRLSRQLGGRARPASGAMEGAKGDIDLGSVLMEAKSTTGLSMGLKRDWLLKIAHEARSEGKNPALAISFVTPDGRPILDGEWVAVPRHVWEGHLK
ncbi:hypothetical protein JYP52_21285 [Nitratireductor aquibiodomus]|uniref:hypothetical protein n=1 Tax=Nitratireductor TaxID=245876 RepID=UPI0013AF806C|nr:MULTISPECIES: hypothetical protein [Nitratireductor]MBN7763675.1 hypothetical protein [Nitratireductor aquibiodomus]